MSMRVDTRAHAAQARWQCAVVLRGRSCSVSRHCKHWCLPGARNNSGHSRASCRRALLLVLCSSCMLCVRTLVAEVLWPQLTTWGLRLRNCLGYACSPHTGLHCLAPVSPCVSSVCMVRLSHPVCAARLNGRQGLCWPTKRTCGFNEGRTQLMVLHTAARLSRGSDSRCGVCWSTAIAPTHFTCLCNILLACPACHKTSAWLRRHGAEKLGGARPGLQTCLLWCGAGGWGCFTACRGATRS
jgi:hypothetical protein